MFSTRSFIILDIIFRSLIHSQFIFLHLVKHKDLTSIFCMRIGCFSNYLLKRVFFHYFVVLAPLLKIICPLYMGLRNKPWALLFSLVCMSVSMLVPLCFIYYSFAISSEIRKCVRISTLLFLCKIILAIRVP